MSEVLCDSSSIIALTTSCYESIIPFLNSKGIDFIIPPSVVDESVNHPLTIKKRLYHTSALKIKRLIRDKKILIVETGEMPLTKKILELANSMFSVNGKYIHLVDLGEAAMIAMAKELGIKTLLMDERTTRMLIEAPFELKEHLSKELRTEVKINKTAMEEFESITKDMAVIRSAELVALAYEQGFFKAWKELEKEFVLSLLYKVKYNGCSLSFEELDEYKGYLGL